MSKLHSRLILDKCVNKTRTVYKTSIFHCKCDAIGRLLTIQMFCQTFCINDRLIHNQTRRLGNLRTHIIFRPHSFTFFFTYVATKWWWDRKLLKTYTSFNKQPMRYNNATLEGPWEFLIIGLQESFRNQTTNIIHDQNSMTVKKNHNKSNLASEKYLNKKLNSNFIRKSMRPVLNATA